MAKKKPDDPHKDCPALVWMGVDWQCTNHNPPVVVSVTREPHKARGAGPRPTAPVPRPVRDRDLEGIVAALEIKLLALTESHDKLQATVDAMKSS